VVYFGSADANIYALNASSGTKLWSYPTSGYVESSPAVVNGVVYIGSLDGNIYALTNSAPITSEFPTPVFAAAIAFIFSSLAAFAVLEKRSRKSQA
jgi:outer membrane protein assembly factor BamB